MENIFEKQIMSAKDAFKDQFSHLSSTFICILAAIPEVVGSLLSVKWGLGGGSRKYLSSDRIQAI